MRLSYRNRAPLFSGCLFFVVLIVQFERANSGDFLKTTVLRSVMQKLFFLVLN